MLAVDGITKRYGDVVALDGVSLTIDAGQICALLGPNGAGKTTLVSIVCGLRRPDDGSVTVDGIDAVRNSQQARCRIGFAPQELAIYPVVSVRQNLVFAGELADLRRAELVRRVDEVAESLELTQFLDRPARDLSGGEKRRVHTGMAMVGRPQLLLLDEPTTGVDVATRVRLLDAVRQLAEQDETAVCYSTHYLPEVEALGASVTIIDRGRVVAEGEVTDLIRMHARTVIELHFDGSAPAIRHPSAVTDGDVVRVETHRPAEDAASILAGLDGSAAQLRGLEIITPSLESVFLTLTGRRYDADVDHGGLDDAGTEEVDDVVDP